jgi:hypothetical protein
MCVSTATVVVARRVVVAVGVGIVVVSVVGCVRKPTVVRPLQPPDVRLDGAGDPCEEVCGAVGRDGDGVELARSVVAEAAGRQPGTGLGVPVGGGRNRPEVAGGGFAGGVDAVVLLARDIGLALVDDTLLKSTVIKIALITTRT